jgi:hypothetical protein
MSTGTVNRGDFAWQAHIGVESWVARADLKASILLALQGGAFILVVAGSDSPFQAPARWPAVVALAALGILVIATCLAAAAVMPILGSPRRLRTEHRQHTVYFGHLRLWEPEALGSRLATLSVDDEHTMLARQLVFLSRLAWRKHRLLQTAVVMTIVVVVALAVATVAAQVDAGQWPILAAAC